LRGNKLIAEDNLKKTSERLGNLEREREEMMTKVNRLANELRIA